MVFNKMIYRKALIRFDSSNLIRAFLKFNKKQNYIKKNHSNKAKYGNTRRT